jgi:hypothetical protein
VLTSAANPALTSIRLGIVLCACWTLIAAPGLAGQQSAAPVERDAIVFPDATFEGMFRKFTPPVNDLSPLYSWDAHMALDVTVVRIGSSALDFRSLFQSAGTENLGSRISVGGTGYVLALAFVRTYSETLHVSGGLAHLSSHLTRDLDEKLEEVRAAGDAVPDVADPSEYNVLFVSAHRTFPDWHFAPAFDITLAPFNFRFNGSDAGYVRPVYVRTRARMWRGAQKSLVVKTQHEIGPNPFNQFMLSFELDGRSRPEGRLQIFLSASPGHSLHVSPNVGALRDGVAFGLRMAFGEEP